MNRRAGLPQRIVGLLVAMAITASAWAHHSAAGYDLTKILSAQATLKEFRWSSPHSAAVFVIKGPDGKAEDMTVASASPAMFVKQGFQPRDFQVGDKVEISWHPARSGHLGGMLASMKFPNGRVFKDVEFAPGGPINNDVLNQAETAQ
jgi:hypothetical protein